MRDDPVVIIEVFPGSPPVTLHDVDDPDERPLKILPGQPVELGEISLRDCGFPITFETVPCRPIHRAPDFERRTKHNPREAVFARRWEDANHPPSFVNHGYGTLDWLLCSEIRDGLFGQDYAVTREPSQSEASAAAAAIQWLGTNCGWCFMEECLRELGYDIVRRKRPEVG